MQRQLIAEQWDQFVREVIPKDAPAHQKQEMRRAFYAGNPKENVLTPFMGVGSEVAAAIVNGRRGIGIELKPSYYQQAVRNIRSVIQSGGWTDDLQSNMLDAEESSLEII